MSLTLVSSHWLWFESSYSVKGVTRVELRHQNSSHWQYDLCHAITALRSDRDDLRMSAFWKFAAQLWSFFFRWNPLRRRCYYLIGRDGVRFGPSQACQVGIFKVKFQKFGLFWSCLEWKNGVWLVLHGLVMVKKISYDSANKQKHHKSHRMQ